MIVSPVQLQMYCLDRVRIEPREEVEGIRPPAQTPVGQNWEGVNFHQALLFGWADEQGDDPRNFALRLRIQLRNEEGTLAPYTLDVEVTGYFELNKDVPASNKEDLARVNGAALLYGVIRDTVYSITARSSLGPCILPTVNFLDLKDANNR